MLVEKEQGGGWGQSCAKAIVGPRHIQIFEKSIYPNRFNFDLSIFLFAQVSLRIPTARQSEPVFRPRNASRIAREP